MHRVPPTPSAAFAAHRRQTDGILNCVRQSKLKMEEMLRNTNARTRLSACLAGIKVYKNSSGLRRQNEKPSKETFL